MRKLFLYSLMIVAIACAAWAETERYVDSAWGFSIEVPHGWVCSSANDIFAKLKQDAKLTPDSLKAMEESGLVVNIAERPLGKGEGINPNVGVSAKVIQVEPKLQNDDAILAFSRKALQSIVKDDEIVSGAKTVNINGLKGLDAHYAFTPPGGCSVAVRVVILVSSRKETYYIITATALESALKRLDSIIESFKVSRCITIPYGHGFV